MRDFLRTLMAYAERNGCIAQPLDDSGNFEWSGPLPKPTLEELSAFEAATLDEEARVSAIHSECESRITAFAGIDIERIRELAESVALIYQGVRSTLPAPLQAQLDAKMATFTRIKNIRTEAARLIADPNATPNWPE